MAHVGALRPAAFFFKRGNRRQESRRSRACNSSVVSASLSDHPDRRPHGPPPPDPLPFPLAERQRRSPRRAAPAHPGAPKRARHPKRNGGPNRQPPPRHPRPGGRARSRPHSRRRHQFNPAGRQRRTTGQGHRGPAVQHVGCHHRKRRELRPVMGRDQHAPPRDHPAGRSRFRQYLRRQPVQRAPHPHWNADDPGDLYVYRQRLSVR